MVACLPPYLTTRELADLIRVKERKVYELAAAGAVPHSRATGKLLFPRDAVIAWLAHANDGVEPVPERPPVMAGSYDPLLDWAVRESESGFSTLSNGSEEGLKQFANDQVSAVGLHIPTLEGWNETTVALSFQFKPVVLIEWAWRKRGLIVPRGNPGKVHSLHDLPGLRVVERPARSGSSLLLHKLLAEQKVSTFPDIEFCPFVRDERDVGFSVLSGLADVAFGLEPVARQSQLDFIPICEERYDLLVGRYEYFQPAFQKLRIFCRDPRFLMKVEELGGYRRDGFGTVHFNGD